MTAKRIFAGLFALITLLTLAGCTSPRLPEGRYSAAGRDDFALVNNDLIFLHITTPAENPSPFAFWDWAGGYSLSPEGVLTPDMETELLKKWSFYYSFRYEKHTEGHRQGRRAPGSFADPRSPRPPVIPSPPGKISSWRQTRYGSGSPLP
ncbi:MAG: hypothetical protein V8T86_13855 [Victivallis sp.]